MLQSMCLTSALLTASIAIAETPPTPPPASASITINEPTQQVLSRLAKQFADLPGVQATAKHRIQAPNKTILHESVREITIVKPNRIKVMQDGIPLLVSNGTTAWTIPSSGTTFAEHVAPATLPDCIEKFLALGNGGVAGSGGLMAALLSPNPIQELLREADAVSAMPKGDDDLLVIRIGPGAKRLREGLRLGIFIPRSGPAWPAQMDIIPPGAEVFTRVAFTDWAVTDGSECSFTKPEITAPAGTFNPAVPVPKNKSNAKPASGKASEAPAASPPSKSPPTS